jgi:hypothetical protein
VKSGRMAQEPNDAYFTKHLEDSLRFMEGNGLSLLGLGLANFWLSCIVNIEEETYVAGTSGCSS